MSDTINANTFVGAPHIGGMLFSAPAGTPLPEDATSPLHEDFAMLGALSKEGINASGEPAVEPILDAGGRNIRNIVGEDPLTYSLTFLEALNIFVLRELRGEANVIVSSDGKTIRVNGVEGFLSPARVYVIELADYPVRKRIVIKLAQAMRTGDVTYNSEAPGEVYETVLNVLSATDGTDIRMYEITQLDGMLPITAA